ncbi:SAV_915 family protein [Streptomyces violaceorubidus]|uniref:SAV_915 family protein n=1 Tax=Streptomyces violaceorubidus TaxID=284042 RepID=UPI000566FDBE|nr:SAV_915 family protein [Streptomyces violaceorubidus]
MTQTPYGEDPDPSEPLPAGPLYVPVRPGSSSCTIRLFRTPLGGRTAVGFTSERRLVATLGAHQARIRLAEPALRALTTPLGVTTVTVNPQFTAPAPAPDPASSPAPVPASAPAPDLDPDPASAAATPAQPKPAPALRAG